MDVSPNSLEQIEFYFSHPENLSHLSRSQIRDILHVITSTANNTANLNKKAKYYELLYQCCYKLDLDIKELWNIYWIINYATFENCNIQTTSHLDELYRFIFEKISDMVDISYERIEHPDNLIILINSQFLSEQHAPTRRILDYAYAIANTLHKKVMIINDAGLHFYPCSCLDQHIWPNFVYNLNNASNITYKGMDIPFMQLSSYMPDIYCLNEALSKIYELRPELVYNIGGSSLLTDLCSTFTKTACLPCSTDIPITMSRYLLVGRDLEESDQARLYRLEPYQQIIETLFNFQFAPNDQSYERSQFGLTEGDFVIGIIGNRLDGEIDDKFISVLHQISNQFPVHFLFVGNIVQKNRITDNAPDMNRFHFAGLLSQASQAMPLLDIYCNPTRNGGGRSSFEALAQGIPIITLRHGDVYHTCGKDFSAVDYDDYIQKIGQYVSDLEYRKEMKEKAIARANSLSDIGKTQEDILKQIL